MNLTNPVTFAKKMSKKQLVIIAICGVVLISSIMFLRANPTYDVGGYKLPQSPSVAWSSEHSPQADFSNDDSWNESYLWSHYSSQRICNFDLAEMNPNELNGSRYSSVGSTMATAPQLAATCLVPVPQKSLLLLVFNLLLAGFGCFLIARLFFSRAPSWIGFAFAATGPMIIYGAWPHSTSFAWIPLCVYSVGLIQLKGFSYKRALISLILQVCLLLSGQPEITMFGFVLMYSVFLSVAIAKRSKFKSTLFDISRLGVISGLAGALSAFALLPVAGNALGSSAAEARGVIAWVPFSVEWASIKSNLSALAYQFLDPGLHSNANTYRTVISPLPFSRLTTWVGFIAIALIVSTLIFARKSKDNKEQNVLNDNSVLSVVRYISVLAAISLFISMRTPWTEAICSRLPILGSLDRNLFRYLTAFLIFFAAIACCHLVTKKILISTFAIFALSRFAVFAYLVKKSSDLNDATKAIRDGIAISYSTIVFQRWVIVVLSIIALVVFVFALKTKKIQTLRILLALAICIELVQVFAIRPQNWVETKPSKTAQEVSKIINDSHQRFIAPGTYFATIGTWLDAPSPTGYSLISKDQKDYIEDIKGCIGLNEFIYFSCSYDGRDKNFYDVSNVGWVLTYTSLENVEEKYRDDLVEEKKLKNGFSLFKRKGNPSAIFSVDKKYCDMKTNLPDIGDVEIEAVSSKITYSSDPDTVAFESEAKLPECSLLSLSYDEGYELKSGKNLKARSLGGFMLVDTKNAKSNELIATFASPGRSSGNLLSFSTLLLLIGMATFMGIKRKKSTPKA